MRTNLREHLDRVGMTDARSTDVMTDIRIVMADHMINVVESAMLDEGIDEKTIQRVVRLIIYGVSGTPDQVMQAQMISTERQQEKERNMYPLMHLPAHLIPTLSDDQS
jgi:hypothetical protein